MKTLIHVNQHKIRAGDLNPLTVKTYKENREAREAEIVVDGKVVAKIVYSPDKPLSCGARVWIETEHDVNVIVDGQADDTDAEAPCDLFWREEVIAA